jgi:hypothetical protein
MIPLAREFIFSYFNFSFMIKYFIYTALSFILVFTTGKTARAQISKPGITLGGYLMYSKPKGGFGNAYNFGGGGELFGGVGLGKTYVIATAGLSEFKAQPGLHTGTLTYKPLKIGIRHFLFKKILFINADIGRATVRNRTFNETRFTRGFGVGAKLLGLEAGLYYDGWKNVNAGGFSNSMNFKVGWNLSL